MSDEQTYHKVKAFIEIEDPEINLVDKYCRRLIKQLETKIQTINERTKMHTIDINNLKKEIRK